MKLTRVRIAGLRTVQQSVIELDPVTLFTGPNGAGKTTVVGAIGYALTGRFPSMVGATAEGLLTLAADPCAGFSVAIQTDASVAVERGVGVDGGKPKHRLTVKGSNGKWSKNVTEAEAVLRECFGDVKWFLDQFDPELSVWRMSAEKRKEWALRLCASASGWSPDQLVARVGPPSEYWDPFVRTDAGASLDANLARASETIKGLQKLIRDANAVADGVTTDSSPDDLEAQVSAAETAYDDARSRTREISDRVTVPEDRRREADRVEGQRRQLTERIQHARNRLSALLPPTAPTKPPFVDVGALRRQLERCDKELTDQMQELNALRAKHTSAGGRHLQATADMESVQKDHVCPLCGTDRPLLDALEHRIRESANEYAKLGLSIASLEQAYGATSGETKDLREQVEGAERAEEAYQFESRLFDERKKTFDTTWQTVMQNLQAAELELGQLPAARVYAVQADNALLRSELAKRQANEQSSKATVASLRAQLGVARERAVQLKAVESARVRLNEVKALQERMRVARGDMLTDALLPLSKALAALGELAPQGGTWIVFQDGDSTGHFGVTLALYTPDGRQRPVQVLSAGEQLRGTLALLIARSAIAREPFVGIFVDNLEQVFPEVDRLSVLRALVQAEKAGFVDNALVAAACPPMHAPGVRTYDYAAGAETADAS